MTFAPDPAALAEFNRGIEAARREYDPEPTRASFEYGHTPKPTPRPRFTRDQKLAAVAAVLEYGERQSDVAERFGTAQTTLSNWCAAARKGEL